MNKKFMSAAALLMGGVVAVSGCTWRSSQFGKPNEYDETVVATVGGQDIKLSDFNFAYYTTAGMYTQYVGTENWEDQELSGEKLGDYVRESSMTELKQLVAAELKAPDYDLDINGEVRDDAEKQKKDVIEDDSQGFGGEDGYNDYLESLFTSDAAVSRYLLRVNIVNKLLDITSAEGGECEVTDEEMAETYNDDNYFKVKHVLISTGSTTNDDGETVEVSKEEALAKANEVIEKLNAGEDMDVLIEQYNDDPGMENQEYYVFTEGEMVDSFYEASKALEIGSWSQTPVESDYGYHVIRRYPLDPENDEQYKTILTQKKQEKFMELLTSWADALDSEVNDDAIDSALEKQRAAQAEKKDAENAENTDSADSGDGSADAVLPDIDTAAEPETDGDGAAPTETDNVD